MLCQSIGYLYTYTYIYIILVTCLPLYPTFTQNGSSAHISRYTWVSTP